MAEIEIEINQNYGHIKYLKNLIDKGVEARNNYNSTITIGDYPTILIVLESPHKDEYLEERVSPLLNPVSSKRLSDYLLKNLYSYVTMAVNNIGVYTKASRDIENGVYRVKLVNAVQFQCSLGLDLNKKKYQNLKNEIVEKCLKDDVFEKDLVERLKNAAIIINCCTGQKGGKLFGLQKIVQNIIDKSNFSAVRLFGYHPCSLYFLEGFKNSKEG